jgi:hypothetical protein
MDYEYRVRGRCTVCGDIMWVVGPEGIGCPCGHGKLGKLGQKNDGVEAVTDGEHMVAISGESIKVPLDVTTVTKV